MFTSGEPATPKGARTRARVLESALALFRDRGYATTTLRDIASEADVSLGLVYRYFRSKDDLVVAIYEDVANRVVKHVERLPEGTIGERFEALLDFKLRILSPQKDAFGALLAAAVNPASEASVLGAASSQVREAMRSAFRAVVAGATDAPADEAVDGVALLLYATHLALLLVWVHDGTRSARRTRDLLTITGEAIGFLRPFLGVPGAVPRLIRLTSTLAPILSKETLR
jgi:AcrR family transcriptional regulator